MKRLLCALVCMFCFGAVPAFADAPAVVSTHNDWKVYTFMDGAEKVCFMSGQPRTQAGKFKKRGEVFFFITYWSGEKSKNVVSVSNGYTFQPGSTVSVNIDGKKFSLFTQGEMAWTKNQNMDDAITEAVRKGVNLVVKGSSKRGTLTTDTYNLAGGAAAYQSMTKECNGK